MENAKLEIGADCYLQATYYGEGIKPDVDLVYGCIQQDPWYGTTSEEVSIKDIAAQIIEFLKEHAR